MFGLMDFSGALVALRNGQKVKRAEWKGYLEMQVPDEHSKMNRPYIFAKCAGGEVVPAVINNLDIMADDWSVLV